MVIHSISSDASEGGRSREAVRIPNEVPLHLLKHGPPELSLRRFLGASEGLPWVDLLFLFKDKLWK